MNLQPYLPGGKRIVSLLTLALLLLLSACSPAAGAGPVVPQEGIWTGDATGAGSLSLMIGNQQIQYVNYSALVMAGNAQVMANCVFPEPIAIQPDGTFSSEGLTGRIEGAFDTATTGKLTYEFTSCSGTTTTGQPAMMQGSVSGEATLEFLP